MHASQAIITLTTSQSCQDPTEAEAEAVETTDSPGHLDEIDHTLHVTTTTITIAISETEATATHAKMRGTTDGMAPVKDPEMDTETRESRQESPENGTGVIVVTTATRVTRVMDLE